MMNNNNNNLTNITTTSSVSDKDDHFKNKSIADYKNLPVYILFISSLKSNHIKIKYDGCFQKYPRHPCNSNIESLSDVLSKDHKVIEKDTIPANNRDEKEE